MKKGCKNFKGFTLAEVLATTFIIGILSVILVVNWRENEKNYLIRQVAQEIVQNIRKAQGIALSGKNYSSEGIKNIDFYGVLFEKNNKTSYKIFGSTHGNNGYQPSDFSIEDVVLDPNTEIDSLSSGNNKDLNILFSIPDGFTTFYYPGIGPSVTSASITIKRTGTTCPSKTCRSIIIKNTGQITIQ